MTIEQTSLKVEANLQAHIQLNLDKILRDYPGVTMVKVVADEHMGYVYLETVGGSQNINIKGTYGYTGPDQKGGFLSAVGRAIRENLGILNTAVIHLDERGKIKSISQELSREIVR